MSDFESWLNGTTKTKSKKSGMSESDFSSWLNGTKATPSVQTAPVQQVETPEIVTTQPTIPTQTPIQQPTQPVQQNTAVQRKTAPVNTKKYVSDEELKRINEQILKERNSITSKENLQRVNENENKSLDVDTTYKDLISNAANTNIALGLMGATPASGSVLAAGLKQKAISAMPENIIENALWGLNEGTGGTYAYKLAKGVQGAGETYLNALKGDKKAQEEVKNANTNWALGPVAGNSIVQEKGQEAVTDWTNRLSNERGGNIARGVGNLLGTAALTGVTAGLAPAAGVSTKAATVGANALSGGARTATYSNDPVDIGVNAGIQGATSAVFMVASSGLSKVLPIYQTIGQNVFKNAGIGGLASWVSTTTNEGLNNIYKVAKGEDVSAEEWRNTFFSPKHLISAAVSAIGYGLQGTIKDAQTAKAEAGRRVVDYLKTENAVNNAKYQIEQYMRDGNTQAAMETFAKAKVAINIASSEGYKGVVAEPTAYNNLMNEWNQYGEQLFNRITPQPSYLGLSAPDMSVPNTPAVVPNVPTTPPPTTNISSAIPNAVANATTTTPTPNKVSTDTSLDDIRDFKEVGNRKLNAYQYDNPEVKPFFQHEAQNMLRDLNNVIKGERTATWDDYGELRYSGVTRETTKDIADLLDGKKGVKLSYDDIRKGLEAIIKDQGSENIAAAKRIEMVLDNRLRKGYTDSYGATYEPNENYKNFLQGKEYIEPEEYEQQRAEEMIASENGLTEKQTNEITDYIKEISNDTTLDDAFKEQTLARFDDLNNYSEFENIKNDVAEYKNSKPLLKENRKPKQFKKDIERKFEELTGDSILRAGTRLAGIELRNNWRRNGNLDGELEQNPYSEEAMKLYNQYQNSQKSSSHLYHATGTDRLESIIKNGLTTGNKQNQEGVSSSKELYLSATPELAESFAPNDSVTLRINPRFYDKFENFKDDWLGGEGSYSITNNIPPEMLQIKENNKWIPLLNSKQAKQANANIDQPKQPDNMLPTNEELLQQETKNIEKEPITEMATNVSSKSYSLKKGLDKFYSGNYGENDSIIVLDETPEYFYNLGYELNQPIVINMQKLKSVTAEPKGTFNGVNQHGITRDLLEQLPNALQNPLNVIKNPKYRNRFVIVTELADQYGDIVIVPIEMNTKGYIEGIFTDVNRIVSTYGKEMYDLIREGQDKSYIDTNKDNIVYDIDEAKKIRNSTVNPNPGLQLSNAENTSVSINNSIPPSNNSVNLDIPNEDIETSVPTEPPRKVRKHVETIAQSPSTPKEVAKDIRNDERKYYTPQSNEETLSTAKDIIDGDYDRAERRFIEKELNTAEDVAVADLLIQKAVADGDYAKADELAISLSEKLTKAGQVVQAASIIKRLSPEGMLIYAEKELSNVVDKIKHENPRWFNKLIDQGVISQGRGKGQAKINLTDAEKKTIVDNMSKAASLEDGREKDILVAKTLEIIANKIPSSTLEKVASLRRSGLLMNFKTLLRNVGSNVAFGTLEAIKDIPATAIDMAVSLITGERTTSLPNMGAYVQGAFQGGKEAAQDLYYGIDTTFDSSGGKYELPSKTFKRESSYKDIADAFKKMSFKDGAKMAFKRLLSDYEDAAMFAVNGTDRPFWQGRFESELANQMKLKGLKYGEEAPTKEMLETAKESADYATFKNKNKLSSTLSMGKMMLNNGKPIGIADALGLTFTNVPGSVGSKIYDYTAGGFIKSAQELYNAAMKNGEFNQRRFVDYLARSLTGVGGIALLGGLIAKGILTGSYDDDKDKADLEREMGIQKNAINLSALGRLIKGDDPKLQKGDKFYNFDWVQPVSGLAILGANLYKKATGNSQVDTSGIVSNLDDENEYYVKTKTEPNYGDLAMEFFATTANQVADMSSLGSFSDLFKGYEGLGGNLADIPGNFASSFIPTLSNNIAQYTDETARNTKDNTSKFKTSINKIINKIPKLRETLEPKVNTLGEEKQQYVNGNDFVSTFLNPGYYTTYDPSDVQQELMDVYEETGDKTIFPSTSPGSITFKKETVKLKPEGVTEFQKASGQYASSVYDALLDSDFYKTLEPSDKAKILTQVATDSTDVGKAAVGIETDNYFKLDTKREQLDKTDMSLADYYIYASQLKGINGKQAKINYIANITKAINEQEGENYIDKDDKAVLYDIFGVN